MQPADDRELDPAARAAALRLADAANDAQVPVPHPRPVATAPATAGWDPAEIWRTRIRDARRGSGEDDRA